MTTLVNKAVRAIRGNAVSKASRGTMSGYTIGVSPMWGQPFPSASSGDAQGLITPERMREIVMKTATAGASMNAVLDYAGGVKLNIRNRDASKPVPKWQIKTITNIMTKPNPMQTSRQFRLSLMKDIFTFGFGAIEIEPDEDGNPANLWVLDAARLRIDFDEHGTVRGYDMLDAHGIPIVRGQASRQDIYSLPSGVGIGSSAPVRMQGSSSVDNQHAWAPEEVIFFSLNPISNSVYPYSRITQLFTVAVIEDLMMYFISTRFTDSNVPFGIMDLGDVNEMELRTAISNWNAQAKDQHRILLTGSKGGSKWIPFGYHLKDLEATGLLAEVRGKIMAILGVTMNELGESQDVNKSNGYNLSFTFKKRAIEPMLNEITETLSRRLAWDSYGFSDLEFYYDEIDSRDELLQAQIDDVYLKSGVVSFNQIRNRRGDISVPGGDDLMVFTGSSWVPIDMLRQMAQSMLMAEQAGGTMTGPDGADQVRVKVGQQQQSSPGKKPEGAVQAQRQVSGSKK